MTQAVDDPIGTLGPLVSEPIEGFQNVQQKLDPFPPGDQNATWATGWYGGYVLGQLVLTALAAGAFSKVALVARQLPRVGKYVRALGGARAALGGYALSTTGRAVSALARYFPEIDPGTAWGRQMARSAMQSVRGMPTPALQRLLSQLDRTDAAGATIRQWMIDVDDPTRVGQTLRYLGATGQAGKQLLAKAIDGRDALAGWMVRTRQSVAFQRQLTTAWRQNDELTLADLDDLRLNYQSLDAGERAAYQRLISRTGAQGLDASSDADSGGLSALVRLDDGPDADPDVVADGGDSPATTLLRADAKNDDIDSAAIASKILDDLSENEADLAKQVIGETGEPGVRFVRDLHSDDFQRLQDGVIGGLGYDPEEIAVLVRNADGRASDLVRDLDAPRIAQTLDLGDAEQQRLAEIAYGGSIDGDARFASDGIAPGEILRAVDDPDVDVDVDGILVAAKDPDDNLRLLTPAGWRHIRDRHVDGTELNPNADETTYFPRGQEVTRGGETVELEPPEADPVTDAQIKRMIREVVEDGGGTVGVPDRRVRDRRYLRERRPGRDHRIRVSDPR